MALDIGKETRRLFAAATLLTTPLVVSPVLAQEKQPMTSTALSDQIKVNGLREPFIAKKMSNGSISVSGNGFFALIGPDLKLIEFSQARDGTKIRITPEEQQIIGGKGSARRPGRAELETTTGDEFDRLAELSEWLQGIGFISRDQHVLEFQIPSKVVQLAAPVNLRAGKRKATVNARAHQARIDAARQKAAVDAAVKRAIDQQTAADLIAQQQAVKDAQADDAGKIAAANQGRDDAVNNERLAQNNEHVAQNKMKKMIKKVTSRWYVGLTGLAAFLAGLLIGGLAMLARRRGPISRPTVVVPPVRASGATPGFRNEGSDYSMRTTATVDPMASARTRQVTPPIARPGPTWAPFRKASAPQSGTLRAAPADSRVASLSPAETTPNGAPDIGPAQAADSTPTPAIVAASSASEHQDPPPPASPHPDVASVAPLVNGHDRDSKLGSGRGEIALEGASAAPKTNGAMTNGTGHHFNDEEKVRIKEIFDEIINELKRDPQYAKNYDVGRNDVNMDIVHTHLGAQVSVTEGQEPLLITRDRVTLGQDGTDEEIKVALLYAQKAWEGKRLEIRGSDEFKAKALRIAQENRIDVTFVEPSQVRTVVETAAPEVPKRATAAEDVYGPSDGRRDPPALREAEPTLAL